MTSHDEFRDRAERFNRMADTLAESIRRLEAAQHQNRRFVADVAHELRTPLAALVAEASILREHLDALPLETRRTAELLVNDVGGCATSSRSSWSCHGSTPTPSRSPSSPSTSARLIETVRTSRSPNAGFRAPEPVIVDADPRRLERILGNFLDNAKGSTPRRPGSRSRWTVARDQIVVAVSDRGPGVPEDRLELIFERFTKVDPSRSGGSSGLGLAIAAEHAALMGGYLQATNREGGGLRTRARLADRRCPIVTSGACDVRHGERRWGPEHRTRSPPS